MSNGASGCRVELIARGDSCAILCRGGQVVESFPLDQPEKFGFAPEFLSSADSAYEDRLQRKEWEMQPGDILVLASDALAKWLLQARGGEWEEFIAINDIELFQCFVRTKRDATDPKLDNDDVACFRLTASEGEPEVVVLKAVQPDENSLKVVSEKPSSSSVKPFPSAPTTISSSQPITEYKERVQQLTEQILTFNKDLSALRRRGRILRIAVVAVFVFVCVSIVGMMIFAWGLQTKQEASDFEQRDTQAKTLETVRKNFGQVNEQVHQSITPQLDKLGKLPNDITRLTQDLKSNTETLKRLKTEFDNQIQKGSASESSLRTGFYTELSKLKQAVEEHDKIASQLVTRIDKIETSQKNITDKISKLQAQSELHAERQQVVELEYREKDWMMGDYALFAQWLQSQLKSYYPKHLASIKQNPNARNQVVILISAWNGKSDVSREAFDHFTSTTEDGEIRKSFWRSGSSFSFPPTSKSPFIHVVAKPR